MSNDRYEKIRKALAMGPTPGPWEVTNGTDVFTQLGARNAAWVEAAANDGWYIADCDMGPSFTEEGEADIPYVEKRANAALIASCDPDTIRALLDERDELKAENDRLHEQLRLATVDQAIAEAEANDVRRNAGVHVPGDGQPAAPDVEAMVEALEAALMVMTSKEVRLEKQADAITMVRSQLARLRDAVHAAQAQAANADANMNEQIATAIARAIGQGG